MSGLGTSDLNLTVNVPAGTGDWFGSWEGDRTPEPDRYATADASAGRMVEMIERGQPAVMLCHWPGMYCNGTKIGFHAFQRVVTSLNRKYGNVTQWMKLSEMARYWAVKELATITTGQNSIAIDSPFACPQFTIKVAQPVVSATVLAIGERTTLFKTSGMKLDSGTFSRDGQTATLCFDVQRGKQHIELALAQ